MNQGTRGSSLLDKSTAHPGSIDKSIFEKKAKPGSGTTTGQGSVNPNYLQECRADNPEPAQASDSQPQVALSNCRFLTPAEELRLEEPFEMAVDAKLQSGAAATPTRFVLYCFVTKDGKEQRSFTWSGDGKPDNAKADPVVIKATGKLVAELGTEKQGKAIFELEAEHPNSKEKARSPRVEVGLKVMAHWMGGDDLHFRTDGEFPLLGAEGGLIQILSEAVRRIEKPVEKGETVICFGFASSSGEADANRKLSLRRAQAVKAILDRDEKAWGELSKSDFETRDIQQFLSDLHAACGWECDPGAVDGQAGPKTKAAIESFQRECNSRYGTGLKVDGICGPRTWGAVLRAIHGQMQAALGMEESKAPSWPKANWGNAGKGVYGNGEDFATGGDKPEERSVQITFFLPGSEQRLEDPKPGQKATLKDNPVQDEKVVEKKKIDKTGEMNKGEPRSSDQDELFSITSGEVGVLKPSDFAFFDREAKRCDLVSKEIARFFYPDTVSIKSHEQDLKRAQYTKACLCFLNQFSDETDEAKADQLAAKAASHIDAIRTKIEQDESFAERILVKGSGMESGWVQKVYRASGKRAVWVRSTTLKSHVRMMSKQQVFQSIKKEYREDAKEAKKNSAGKSPVKINEVTFYELFDSQKGTWAPNVESYFEELGLHEYLQENSVLQAGADIQALRYSLEGKIGSNFNWKKNREIKVEAKVEGSLSLVAGQGHFDIYLPSKEGFDLIDVVKKVSPGLFKAGTKPMPLQVQLKVSGNAFVGVCGSASGGLGLSLKEKPQGGLECGVEAFAGAKVGAELGIAIRIKLWDEKSNVGKFEDLGEVTYGVWAAVGFGAEFAFKLGYFEDRFRMQVKAGLVLKAGAGHYLKTSINANKIASTIWTICCAVRWDRVHDVLSEAVWDLYQGMMYHALVTGQSLEESAVKLIAELDEFSGAASKTAEAGMGMMKAVDDSFDKYIPGYSGFKKYHPAFHILKSTYESLKSNNQALDAKSRAIRIVQETDKFDRWKYMTPEIKENLLAELAYGASGLEGVDEQREKAIIRILEKTKTPEEFRKILDRLKTRRKIDLDNAVDGPEHNTFVKLKAQNGYR